MLSGLIWFEGKPTGNHVFFIQPYIEVAQGFLQIVPSSNSVQFAQEGSSLQKGRNILDETPKWIPETVF